MKQLLSNIFGFIKSLDPIDILLYFAVVVLIILVVSLIYIIKTSDDDEEEIEEPIIPKKEQNISKNDDLDLKEVMNSLENTNPPISEFTSYESEQEEKAIISYEELLRKNKYGQINYDEEKTLNDEISIKKVNLDKLAEIKEEPVEKVKTNTHNLFRYEKEEAFLKALQTLNQLLN